MEFEWDENKNNLNKIKHHLSFETAQNVFFDKRRIIFGDIKHSSIENRLMCIGFDGFGIASVRFTIRNNKIRILGAGYWRKGRKLYEKTCNLH